MAGLLKHIFTWWNGSSVGLKFFTARKGTFVGEDEFGNKYYEGSFHKDGYRKRWVVYKDISEASTIPPGWHGWIHHRVDISPAEENYQPYFWEKPHQQNMTGTAKAYYPQGSMNRLGDRKKVSGDYEAWEP